MSTRTFQAPRRGRFARQHTNALPRSRIIDRLRASTRAARRKSRPSLALIAVPLALIAAELSAPVCIPALVACAWWWTSRESPWLWMSAALRGALGGEWALLGADALRGYRDQAALVGTLWIAPLAVLIVAGFGQRSGDWFPRAAPRKVGPWNTLRQVRVPSSRRRFAAHVAHERVRSKREP